MKRVVPIFAVVVVITYYVAFLLVPPDPLSIKLSGAFLGIICFGLGLWQGEAARPASGGFRFVRSLGTLGIVTTGAAFASLVCLYLLGEFEHLHGEETVVYGLLDCSGEAADDVTGAFPRIAETLNLSPSSTGPDSYAKDGGQKWYVANGFEEMYVCLETSEDTASVLVYVRDWDQEDERELKKFRHTAARSRVMATAVRADSGPRKQEPSCTFAPPSALCCGRPALYDASRSWKRSGRLRWTER